jgi:hypothetical protein
VMPCFNPWNTHPWLLTSIQTPTQTPFNSWVEMMSLLLITWDNTYMVLWEATRGWMSWPMIIRPKTFRHHKSHGYTYWECNFDLHVFCRCSINHPNSKIIL